MILEFFYRRLASAYSSQSYSRQNSQPVPVGCMEISKRWNRQTCTCPQWGFNISSSGGLYQYHQYPSPTDPDNNGSPPDEGHPGPTDDWEIRWNLSMAEQDGKQILLELLTLVKLMLSHPFLIFLQQLTEEMERPCFPAGPPPRYWNGALAAATRSNRILAIQNFMDTDASNYMLNAIMLYTLRKLLGNNRRG